MSLEPTPDEYDALGRRVLARARRSTRRRSAVQLLAAGIVGASAAALAIAVALGSSPLTHARPEGAQIEAAPQEGSAGPDAAPAESGEAEAYSGEPGEESTGSAVVCYAKDDPDAAMVTIDRARLGAEQAVRACERVWEAGLLAAASLDAAGSEAPAVPSLVACRLPDATIVVLPGSGERRAALCEEPGAGAASR